MNDQVNKLLESDLFVQGEKLLENSMYSATMLHNLISDMMDLAKFETETFTFNYEYFNILDVINKSFEQVRYLADEKGIKLKQST